MRRMSGRFLDTNIVLYMLDDGPTRDLASGIIARGGTISVQMLNDALVDCRRKAGVTWEEAAEFLGGIREICAVVSLSPDIHDIGRAVGARYSFSVYDVMIVAATLAHGCSRLLSEDMQDGLEIEGALTIENPFRALG